MNKEDVLKKAISVETFICLALVLLVFVGIGHIMGAANMLKTMMNTAFALLMDTCFYIMAIAVLAGAIGAVLTEFGVVELINKILSPLMVPLYGLPGAASLGIVTTYLSDNPAIITLTNDREYIKFFEKYQIPALTNIGTAFGMGIIVSTYMLSLQSGTERLGTAVIIGNLGAVIGSIVSTRLMLIQSKKYYGYTGSGAGSKQKAKNAQMRRVRPGSPWIRTLQSLLEGGKNGVDLGLQIIPGVLIICTFVLILTNSRPAGGYTGAAYEGIALLPAIGERLSFILKPLFGFTSSNGIAVPITSLGSAGAAIGLVQGLVQNGLANAHDVAVFTAMCMCWSGYLSTHVAMMDSIGCRELTAKAILSHTIGGICAGVAANWLFTLTAMI